MEHIYSIFVSTYGILFLGTPHHGSSKANLAKFAQRMVDALLPSKVVDTDSQLLDALKEGSEILRDITDNFQPKMKRFRVFFFWEQMKTNLGMSWDYVGSRLAFSDSILLANNQDYQVVEETSAAPILDDTDRAGLRADHRNMAKFASASSPGYRLIVSTLLRYSDDAPSTISRRWIEAKELLRSLRKNEAEELMYL